MTEPDRTDDREPSPHLEGVIRAEHDWSEVPPSTAVIQTVAIASDREPASLEPLYKTVDPDALDALLGSSEIYSTDGDTTVSFVFAGHDVLVEKDGTVVVGPVEPRSDAK